MKGSVLVKIERISENQIRCTLNKHDLIERQLKISELAYGSEKAKQLFRDMMEQANIDLGFDADDIPLMIEAIPTSRDSIILVITKVDNPEELDERFSQFGVPDEIFDEDDTDTFEDEEDSSVADSSELVSCFEQLHDLLEEAENKHAPKSSSEFVPLSETLQGGKRKSKKKEPEPLAERIRVFSFESLNSVMDLAHQFSGNYNGKNTLWKDPVTKRYHLLLNRGKGKNAFRLICTTLSEYGTEETVTYATQTYYNEHFHLILKDNALAKLSEI